jgi:hypothetical protein
MLYLINYRFLAVLASMFSIIGLNDLRALYQVLPTYHRHGLFEFRVMCSKCLSGVKNDSESIACERRTAPPLVPPYAFLFLQHA